MLSRLYCDENLLVLAIERSKKTPHVMVQNSAVMSLVTAEHPANFADLHLISGFGKEF